MRGLLLVAALQLAAPLNPLRIAAPEHRHALLKKTASHALAAALLLPTAALAANEPSPAALQVVQAAMEASFAESPKATQLLSQAIDAWRKEKLPADELAGLLKLRADAKARAGDDKGAEADLGEELSLLDDNADPAEKPRALLMRARLEAKRGAFARARDDGAAALAADEDLPPLEQRNPFAYELVARSASRVGDFATAAKAFGDAEKAHDRVGDAIRARLAAADRALALYAEAKPEAVAETRRVFAQKSTPVSNNPDDVPLLQELSRKDAELHLALAARLHRSDDRDAKAMWETGCLRLRTYVDDAERRIVEDDAKTMPVSGNTPAKRNKRLVDAARSLQAVSSGLDPQNPYVTQQTDTRFLWYELEANGAGAPDEDYGPAGDAKVRRRRVGASQDDAYGKLARVDGSLTCDAFTRADWLTANRPDWPAALREDAVGYSAAPRALDVPDAPAKLVLPDKRSGAYTR